MGGYTRYRSAPGSVSLRHHQSEPAATMAGCTWHTVNNAGGSSAGPLSSSPPRVSAAAPVLAISQHLPPQSPSSNGGNPLASLTQQVQMAMMVENTGMGVDSTAAGQMTEVLLNTVSGISTLRSAVGDHVLSELLSLLLKDGPSTRPGRATPGPSSAGYLPVGLLDN